MLILLSKVIVFDKCGKEGKETMHMQRSINFNGKVMVNLRI